LDEKENSLTEMDEEIALRIKDEVKSHF